MNRPGNERVTDDLRARVAAGWRTSTEIRILGPLEVVDGDHPVALPRGRVRVLVAALALRAGAVVSIERLIDQLWGEAPPPTATKALHGLISTLRNRLDPGQGEHTGMTPGTRHCCAGKRSSSSRTEC